MASVPVNPKVLIWARQERGLERADAAIRLGMEEVELEALEKGDKPPSVGLLRKISEKYEIGFSALLMPEPLPPSTRLKIDDFRTVAAQRAGWTPELLALIDNLNIAIEGLYELKLQLRNDAMEIFPRLLLPRATLDSNPEVLASRERQRLDISVDSQLGWENDSQAFKHWRGAVEGQGVFVYIMRAGEPNEWRGLSIVDHRDIPVAVINRAEDDNQPRAFTLMHEYCHLLLRQSVLSDENRKNEVERFCNQFAAFFLMPRERFLAEAKARLPKAGEDWSDAAIRALGSRFKTSMSAVTIHLETLGLAKAGLYERKLEEWQKRPKKKSSGRAEHVEKLANTMGISHVDTVLGALDAGYIDPIDANELLFDTKPQYFEPLRQEVEERKAAYGWGRRV